VEDDERRGGVDRGALTYTEHAMFVPFASDQLATVLTLPDSDPRGLAVLLQGLGAARSHKNRIWTRMARALAGRGIASVRMDYAGMGDSTGKLRASLAEPPVEEAEAVARVAMKVAGVDQLATVGHCMGARTSFALACRMEECITVATIVPPVKALLRGQGYSTSRRAVERTAARLPKIKMAFRGLLPSTHPEQRIRLLPEVETVLGTRGGFFLFIGGSNEAARLKKTLTGWLTERGESATTRTVFREVAAPGAAGFRIQVPIQPILIDSIVEWMDIGFQPRLIS
jgi:alpha/beta superfamily hydrolase